MSGPVFDARELDGRPAGVVTRTIAGVIDYGLVALAVLVSYGSLAGLLFAYNPVRFTWPQIPSYGLLFLGLVYMFLYLAIAWSLSGKTIGSRVMRVRVVNGTGRRLRAAHASLRALAVAVFPIGLFWSAVSPTSSSVQDLVLRTRVVYDYPAVRPVSEL